MDEPLCYRGRTISDEDVASIRQIIASHPGASRRRLSRLVCQAWEWRQANGAWRDMVCRGLMLALHRGSAGGLLGMEFGALAHGAAGPVHRMDSGCAATQPASAGL